MVNFQFLIFHQLFQIFYVDREESVTTGHWIIRRSHGRSRIGQDCKAINALAEFLDGAFVSQQFFARLKYFY